MSILYTLISGGIALAIIILLAFKYGKKSEQNDNAHADLKAVAEGKKDKEAISKLSDTDLDKRMRDGVL